MHCNKDNFGPVPLSQATAVIAAPVHRRRHLRPWSYPCGHARAHSRMRLHLYSKRIASPCAAVAILQDNTLCYLIAIVAFGGLLGVQKYLGDEWPKVLSSFKILWLFNYPAGSACRAVTAKDFSLGLAVACRRLVCALCARR
eukprot:2319103-Prymnesium_polylepis.1